MSKITKGVAALYAEAQAEIETWSVETAKAHLDDEDVVFVDVRDVRELWREGTIPGSVHAPRGMIEFWVDPESPYARELFQSDKRFVFFCAKDWRSAFATKAVQDMGLAPVCHLEGGFTAWREAGGAIEKREPKPPKE
jgi:rhodanese-related sulfurtransferase